MYPKVFGVWVHTTTQNDEIDRLMSTNTPGRGLDVICQTEPRFSSFVGFILPHSDQKYPSHVPFGDIGQLTVTKEVCIGHSRP